MGKLGSTKEEVRNAYTTLVTRTFWMSGLKWDENME